MARAIWKGVILIGSLEVPVKFYSAVEDKAIRFRLLHRTDHAPVQQKMVDADSGDPVEYADAQKAFPAGKRELVVLTGEDLEQLEPKESRDVEVSRFVDPADVDHRWYERAYFLGPDGNSAAYFAAAAALEKSGREGIARWVMRKKEYVGALRAEDGYLMLITLRHADEVVDASSLQTPGGRGLDARELKMAGQLVEALAGHFDPKDYRDEYRARILELVETKAHGGKVKVTPFRPKKTRDESLTRALQASLAGVGKKAANG